MGKVTVVKDKNYTCITNQIFRDKRLSLKAVGLLVTMLSLPDDWDYTIAGLTAIVKDGKSAVRTALNELEDCGYLVRETVREETGRFADLDYIVYENPQSEKPESENRHSDNHTQLNTNIQNTNELSTKKESKDITWSESSLETEKDNPENTFNHLVLEREITKSVQNCEDKVNDEELTNVVNIIKYYYQKYRLVFGEEHPRINQKAMNGVVGRLLSGTDYIDSIDFEMYQEMIDKHFRTQYKNCDYSICHFMTEGIRNFKAIETGNACGNDMFYD